jgi:hypothetical protein
MTGVSWLTRNISISGMRDLLSTVFARLGSLLKKSVMDSPSTSMLPAKRLRDHTPVPCPAPANSKRFRNATVLAPMVRSGNRELLSTSQEHLGFQDSTPSLDAWCSILPSTHWAPNLPFQVLLIDLQYPLDSCRCNMALRSSGAPK